MGDMPRCLFFTVLSSVEGSREKGFQEHLRKIYHIRGRDVTVCDAHGGGPSKVVQHAINTSEHKSYNELHATFDTDKGDKEIDKAYDKARQHGVRAHKSEPNIDTELVRLLTNDKKVLQRCQESPEKAKEALRDLCHLQKPNEEINWEKYFPKELLDAQRQCNQWLDDQIKIITG